MKIKLFNTGLMQVNTYVVIDETSKEAVIIDLGGDFETVFDYIKNEGAHLKAILHTHGHFDHIMGDDEAKSKMPELPIYINKNDWELAKNIGSFLQQWGIGISYPPIIADFDINENSDFKIGNEKVKVLFTPGHTEGGVCFLIGDNLFSGDTLFMGSIGRTDLQGGDYNKLINSIKNKILPLKDDIKVFPGHGSASTLGEERKNNPYLQ